MYFLQKEGVYLHGVFWIGTDLNEGKKQTDLAAQKCNDDYHNWVLVKYKAPTAETNYRKDAADEIVYRVDV